MIEVRELSKSFGAKRAVDDVTFRIHPGMVTGFLGPNGAGKSTIMKLIVGLERPTSGTATIGGAQYRALASPMAEVGVLLDAGWVHPARTARHHLEALGLTQGYGRTRVDEVLALTGLASVGSTQIRKFSLGMKQRLGLAAALIGDPQFLILDEPVNGLDPDGVIWIRTLLRELAAEGRAVLVSSHLMSEMEQTADRIIVIGRGRVIADGALHEVMDGQNEASVIVRSPRPDELFKMLRRAGAQVTDAGGGAMRVVGPAIAAIGDLAANANIPLHELRVVDGSLEDAYRKLVGDDVVHAAGTRTETRR